MKYGKKYISKNQVPIYLSNEWLLCSIFMLQILNGYIGELLSLWNLSTITTYVYICIMLLSGLAYFKVFVNRPASVFGALLCVAGILAACSIMNPKIMEVVFDFGNASVAEIGNSEIFIFFALCFPTFLLCFLQIDIKQLHRIAYRYSVIVSTLFICLMLLHIFRFSVKLNYMSVAYNVMLPFLIMYYSSREKGDRVATILWMGTVVGILVGGCRGAALTVVMVVFLWEIGKLRSMTAKKFVWVLLAVIFLGFVLLYLKEILATIDTFLIEQGYSSRLFNKYFGRTADGDLFHFSDREKLYRNILTDLNFGGHGVFADRLANHGQYAHNFIFEIIYQYGYFFGGIILIVFMMFVGRAAALAKRSGDGFSVFLVYSFVVYMCTKMMVSASYITDRMFWLFLGLCLVICRQGHSQPIENRVIYQQMEN